jgi:hypothetical protein
MATTNSNSLTHSENPAIGVRGFLIRGLGDTFWFRVYHPDKEFTDYDITHHDCEIVIIDPSAALISNDAGDFLDYTTESMQIVK